MPSEIIAVKEGAKVALKKGAEAAAKSSAKEATKTSKEISKLAKEVAKKIGGVKTPAKGDGYSIQVPNGNHPIKIRIMEKGGERSTPYCRISIENRGTVTRTGEYSSDPLLTHLDLHKNSLDEIINVIKILKK